MYMWLVLNSNPVCALYHLAGGSPVEYLKIGRSCFDACSLMTCNALPAFVRVVEVHVISPIPSDQCN